MKKILIFLVLFLVSCNKNTLLEEKWVKITKENSNLFTVEIDINTAKFSFWWLETFSETQSIFKWEKSTFDRFKRYEAKELLEKNKNILVAINGQFFNAWKTITALSFPLKSDNKIVTTHNDNDKLKKTLIITKENKLKIIDWYNENDLNNSEYKEIIVWINPNEDFIKNEKVWRTFAWIKDDKLIFFINDKASQEDMVNFMEKHSISIENIIMFDGWPSSQFWYKKNDKINTFFGKWWVPHYFVIYK